MRRLALCLTLAAGLLACGGKSGSHPRFYPEVRFLVAPLGGQQGTTFAVEYLASATATHEFADGRTFTATEPVGFFLENAAPPYAASFTWIAGAEADILLVVSGRTVQISPLQLGPENPTVVIMSGGADSSELATSPGHPEVRLEVSAPPGTLFQGTVGDFYLSYDVGLTVERDELLVARAPAIIFFENARETVSAVFRSGKDLEITVELYINGQLRESETSKKDAIVKRDL